MRKNRCEGIRKPPDRVVPEYSRHQARAHWAQAEQALDKLYLQGKRLIVSLRIFCSCVLTVQPKSCLLAGEFLFRVAKDPERRLLSFGNCLRICRSSLSGNNIIAVYVNQAIVVCETRLKCWDGPAVSLLGLWGETLGTILLFHCCLQTIGTAD